MIAGLEREGLIERLPAPEDRRVGTHRADGGGQGRPPPRHAPARGQAAPPAYESLDARRSRAGRERCSRALPRDGRAVSAAAEARPRGAARQHYGITLVVLTTAALAYALSQTMVAPALPVDPGRPRSFDDGDHLRADRLSAERLGRDADRRRLGDMFGKERVLVLTLLSFGAGSLICALSHSVEILIAGRVVQGVAGAIFPLSFGIIRDEFPPERVGTGIGLISATFGIGGGGGLVLSGLIVDNLSYEWMFWLTLPVVAFAVVMAHLFIPESPVRAKAKIDWGGAALLSLGLISVLVAVGDGNDWGWLSPRGDRPDPVRPGDARLLVPVRVAPEGAAGRHEHDAGATRVDHQPRRVLPRLRHVRLLHPDPAARPDPGGVRLRVRGDRDRRRPLPAALDDRDALRRPDLRLARRPGRLEVPDGDGHRGRQSLLRPAGSWARAPSGRSTRPPRASASGSDSRSPRSPT